MSPIRSISTLTFLTQTPLGQSKYALKAEMCHEKFPFHYGMFVERRRTVRRRDAGIPPRIPKPSHLNLQTLASFRRSLMMAEYKLTFCGRKDLSTGLYLVSASAYCTCLCIFVSYLHLYLYLLYLRCVRKCGNGCERAAQHWE